MVLIMQLFFHFVNIYSKIRQKRRNPFIYSCVVWQSLQWDKCPFVLFLEIKENQTRFMIFFCGFFRINPALSIYHSLFSMRETHSISYYPLYIHIVCNKNPYSIIFFTLTRQIFWKIIWILPVIFHPKICQTSIMLP